MVFIFCRGFVLLSSDGFCHAKFRHGRPSGQLGWAGRPDPAGLGRVGWAGPASRAELKSFSLRLSASKVYSQISALTAQRSGSIPAPLGNAVHLSLGSSTLPQQSPDWQRTSGPRALCTGTVPACRSLANKAITGGAAASYQHH